MKKFPIPTTPDPRPVGLGRIIRGFGPGPKRIVADDKPDPDASPPLPSAGGKAIRRRNVRYRPLPATSSGRALFTAC